MTQPGASDSLSQVNSATRKIVKLDASDTVSADDNVDGAGIARQFGMNGVASIAGGAAMVRAYSVALVISAGVFVPAAKAQVPYRTYAPPAGPTLPLQLDYFRPQSGVLDQYNQFVAPKEQLAGQIRGMAQQQNADYQAVEKQLRESDKIRESGAAATGVSAGFMNFSHYYNRSRAAAPAARAPRSVRQFTPSSQTMPAMGFGT